MVKLKLLLILIILSFIYSCSCNNSCEITIVESVKLDFHSNPNIQDIYGCIEYDSICFSDGSRGVYRLNYAPSNSLLEFFDKNDKLIATVAQASECYPQVLFYKYNEKGQILSLIEYYCEDDCVFDIYNKDSVYLDFRNRIQNIDKLALDTTSYTQISFDYDDKGNAVGAYNISNGRKIVAPFKYKLEISVQKCVSFWSSDISGGHYVLKVDVIPVDESLDDYIVRRYVYIDLIPTIEYEYKNAQNIKTTLYPDYEEYSKIEKVCYWKDNQHVYDMKIEGDTNIYRDIWENGLLKTEEVISKYGTVLKRDTYMYSNVRNEVKVLREIIDYKTYKLKRISCDNIELSTLKKEADEMNLLKYSGYWEREY